MWTCCPDFPVGSTEMAIAWAHRELGAQAQLRPSPHFLGPQNPWEPSEGTGNNFPKSQHGPSTSRQADTLLPSGRGDSSPSSTCSWPPRVAQIAALPAGPSSVPREQCFLGVLETGAGHVARQCYVSSFVVGGDGIQSPSGQCWPAPVPRTPQNHCATTHRRPARVSVPPEWCQLRGVIKAGGQSEAPPQRWLLGSVVSVTNKISSTTREAKPHQVAPG